MAYQAVDIMSRDVISVLETMDLRDLAKMLLSKGITGAPVVDEDGNLTGVISQTDLVYYSLTRDDELVADSHFYQAARIEGHHIPRGFQIEDCNTASVADAMTPVVHSVTETASIDTVARMMTRRHIHRVIVRRGRKVTGVISALDVLRARQKKAGTGTRRRGNSNSTSTRRKSARS